MAKREAVGRFALIPWEELKVQDCVDEWVAGTAARLMGMYDIRQSRDRVGAIIRSGDAPVGTAADHESFDGGELTNLRRAVVLGK